MQNYRTVEIDLATHICLFIYFLFIFISPGGALFHGFRMKALKCFLHLLVLC